MMRIFSPLTKKYDDFFSVVPRRRENPKRNSVAQNYKNNKTKYKSELRLLQQFFRRHLSQNFPTFFPNYFSFTPLSHPTTPKTLKTLSPFLWGWKYTKKIFQWHALGREEQAKYYELARRERQLHMQMYPDWSSRTNATRGKKRKRKQEPADGGTLNTFLNTEKKFFSKPFFALYCQIEYERRRKYKIYS